VLTKAQYNTWIGILKTFGEIPKEVNLPGIQDLLIQNYNAGTDSLFVSEYHSHFMSNKSPTRFQ